MNRRLGDAKSIAVFRRRKPFLSRDLSHDFGQQSAVEFHGGRYKRTLGTGIKDTVGSRDFHRGDDHGTASVLILIVADIDYFLALKNHCHRERVKAAPIDCVFFQHADVKSGNSFPIQVMSPMALNCLIYEFFCYFFLFCISSFHGRSF